MSRKSAGVTLCVCLVALLLMQNLQITQQMFAVGGTLASYAGGGWEVSLVIGCTAVASETLVGVAAIMLGVNPFLALGVAAAYGL